MTLVCLHLPLKAASPAATLSSPCFSASFHIFGVDGGAITNYGVLLTIGQFCLANATEAHLQPQRSPIRSKVRDASGRHSSNQLVAHRRKTSRPMSNLCGRCLDARAGSGPHRLRRSEIRDRIAPLNPRLLFAALPICGDAIPTDGGDARFISQLVGLMVEQRCSSHLVESCKVSMIPTAAWD